MITKQMALALTYRTILHHKTLKNADGTPVRCRVNGKCKTWVKQPDNFSLPVKHGLKNCFYINEMNAKDWSLPESLMHDGKIEGSQQTCIVCQNTGFCSNTIGNAIANMNEEKSNMNPKESNMGTEMAPTMPNFENSDIARLMR